jgi:hypothetical protein
LVLVSCLRIVAGVLLACHAGSGAASVILVYNPVVVERTDPVAGLSLVCPLQCLSYPATVCVVKDPYDYYLWS